MALYLDSTNLDEARQAREWGWVRGVTTNPSLWARGDLRPEEGLRELTGLGFAEIYYQLRAPTPDGMASEAERARAIVGEPLVLKITPTPAGYTACSALSRDFPCCVTAVFSAAQALVAQAAGARQVAVYVARATQELGDGPGLVNAAATALRASTGRETTVLAASLKSPEQAALAAAAGAPDLTLGFAVLSELGRHPTADAAVAKFDADGAGLDQDGARPLEP